MKNTKGRGGGVGAHLPSSPDNVGLIREGEGKGGLIEDLRYVWHKESVDSLDLKLGIDFRC